MDDADTSSEPPGRSPERTRALVVDMVDETGRLTSGDDTNLRATVAKALAHLGCEGEVRIRVVDDEAMASAHQRWSGVEGTTDVLTFDLGTEGTRLDADLIVCLDEARRQAGERGHEPWRELLLYVVHGVLHCLGHDDHDEDRAARMHQVEDETLEAIGVGRTYAVGSRDGATQA